MSALNQSSVPVDYPMVKETSCKATRAIIEYIRQQYIRMHPLFERARILLQDEEVTYKIAAPLPSPPRSLNPAISEKVERTILHALAIEPNNRFNSVTAFMTTLKEAVELPKKFIIQSGNLQLSGHFDRRKRNVQSSSVKMSHNGLYGLWNF